MVSNLLHMKITKQLIMLKPLFHMLWSAIWLDFYIVPSLRWYPLFMVLEWTRHDQKRILKYVIDDYSKSKNVSYLSDFIRPYIEP